MKRSLIQKWKNLQKNKIKIGLFLLLFSCANILLAQEIIVIKESKGTAFISGDISPNQAKKKALNEAKINALKAAGIGENIKSFELLYSSQAGKDYQQFFSSNIQSEMQGNILSYEVIKEETVQKSELELYAEVTISASVIKYETKPDVKFDVNIEGIKAVYNNEEVLKFNIKTSQLSFLTIFNITDTEASVFFPNSYEKNNELLPLIIHDFPFESIDYILYTDLKDKETNRLLFVFTKTSIPFIKMDKEQVTNEDAIFNWIYSIMPDQRNVQYYSVIVQK